MTAEQQTCIYPGCDRPAAPPNPLGGPQPAFCESEDHNALSAHQERRRLSAAAETNIKNEKENQ